MIACVFGPQTTGQPLVEGTVVEVRREADEPPDFDLAGALFGVILVLDILVVLAMILVPLFIIALVFILLLGFLGMAGVMLPFMSFGLGALLSFLFPFIPRPGQKAADRVPVTYLRIQDGTGAEYDIRMKGFLRSGSVASSDVLRVWGRRQHGTILLDKALNVRTGAWVEIRKRPTAAMLVALVAANIIVVVLLVSGS